MDNGLDINNLFNSNNKPDEGFEHATLVFKRVFLPGDGPRALAYMLEMLGFFERSENVKDMERNNFAKELLAMVYWDAKLGREDTDKMLEFIKRSQEILRKVDKPVIPDAKPAAGIKQVGVIERITNIFKRRTK